MFNQIIRAKHCNLKGTEQATPRRHARVRIGSTHVAHHVCAAIPFYKAAAATVQIQGVPAGNSILSPILFMVCPQCFPRSFSHVSHSLSMFPYVSSMSSTRFPTFPLLFPQFVSQFSPYSCAVLGRLKQTEPHEHLVGAWRLEKLLKRWRYGRASSTMTYHPDFFIATYIYIYICI